MEVVTLRTWVPQQLATLGYRRLSLGELLREGALDTQLSQGGFHYFALVNELVEPMFGAERELATIEPATGFIE